MRVRQVLITPIYSISVCLISGHVFTSVKSNPPYQSSWLVGQGHNLLFAETSGYGLNPEDTPGSSSRPGSDL